MDLPHCRYPRKPSPLIFRRIHASCRHLEPPPRCSRRRRDCVPLEGLSRQRPRPWKTMRLHPHEFIRRFQIHVLPKGFHRIRHYGLLANGNRSENIAHARELLAAPARPKQTETPEAALEQPGVLPQPCPCCGGRTIIIETFAQIRAQAPAHAAASGNQDRHVMMTSSAIDARPDARFSCPLFSRRRPSSHHYLGFTSASRHAQIARFTPTYPTMLCRKPIAATVTIQRQQAETAA